MLIKEQIYREMLFQAMEKKNFVLTQKDLATRLRISLSTVNFALRELRKMSAITVGRKNFSIINTKKIILYWASVRNLEKDIILKARVDLDVNKIENHMPPGITFTAFSGYRFKFDEVPADYSEIYIYANKPELEEVKRRFALYEKENPNLFVLAKDKNFHLYEEITLAQLFVDLWNLGQWYAKDFLKDLEKKLIENGILA